MGSGTPFAYTAMDMGASAKEAVWAAARRDVGTGGTLRVLQIASGTLTSEGTCG
jgi:hypothetical protein